MCVCACVCLPTGATVVPLHPDVAVVLGHAGLRVQERQADAAFSTQAGIVAAALLNSLLVELVAQPAGRGGGWMRWGGGARAAEVSDTEWCGRHLFSRRHSSRFKKLGKSRHAANDKCDYLHNLWYVDQPFINVVAVACCFTGYTSLNQLDAAQDVRKEEKHGLLHRTEILIPHCCYQPCSARALHPLSSLTLNKTKQHIYDSVTTALLPPPRLSMLLPLWALCLIWFQTGCELTLLLTGVRLSQQHPSAAWYEVTQSKDSRTLLPLFLAPLRFWQSLRVSELIFRVKWGRIFHIQALNRCHTPSMVISLLN